MGGTFWLTGLSKSGKTAIGNDVQMRFNQEGIFFQVLDGSVIRNSIGGFLGYSKSERVKTARILATMANILNMNGINVIVTSITPYEDLRKLIRTEVRQYHEIYISATLDECISRDSSGLYKQAIKGDINNFIGITEPFEIPSKPDLVIINSNSMLEQSSDVLYKYICNNMEL